MSTFSNGKYDKDCSSGLFYHTALLLYVKPGHLLEPYFLILSGRLFGKKPPGVELCPYHIDPGIRYFPKGPDAFIQASPIKRFPLQKSVASGRLAG
jgi:hypothetical protein